jgi:hypothetical protein
MKKVFALLSFILFLSFTSMGQSCLPEGIDFSTQSMIDAFPSMYPGCTKIEGNVEVNGSDIENLDSLIYLTSIDGSLDIYANADLNDFSGMSNLNAIGKWFNFYYTEEVTDFTGFGSLESIGGYFQIESNEGLVSLHGLENLISIGDAFGIMGNSSLQSFEGLNNLSSIDGGLYILSNNSLQTLQGLENIDPSSISTIDVQYNPQLSECEVQSICDFLLDPLSDAVFGSNKNGCRTRQEVEGACETVSVEDELTSSFRTFPNPADVVLNISRSTPSDIIRIQIFNTAGQCLIDTKTETKQVAVDVLQNGLYILKIEIEESVYQQKILINH